MIPPLMKRNPKMKTPCPKNPLLKRNPLPLITNPPPTFPLTVTRKKQKNKNNKNSRGYKSGSQKNKYNKIKPSTKTNSPAPEKANPTNLTSTPKQARLTFPNKPTPFLTLPSNKEDPPKTPVLVSPKPAAKKTPQSSSPNKSNLPKTPGMGPSQSSAKKMPQKDTSKLVQSNLMNMFNKVAHTATGKSIKSVIKASKGNMALDETEETLPPLFHDGSESEEETPMKPPATSSGVPLTQTMIGIPTRKRLP
jgi:hypothetical protein